MTVETRPTMDNTEHLIAELERLDITVWAEAGRIRYKAPQGGLTQEIRQRLVDNKDQLLTRLSRHDGIRRDARLLPITPGSAGKPRPLSYSQQQLWFLAQMLRDSPAYNMQRAYRLRGALDFEALQQALCDIVRRHDSLRTVFVDVDGRPLQVASEPCAWTLPLVDLGGEADAPRRLAHLMRKEGSRPFSLVQGPLFRAQLYRLDAESHVLLFVMHHIISDAWSVEVLLRELGSLYEAFSAGRPSPLEKLPIQCKRERIST